MDVTIEDRDGVSVITLNRPDALNALTLGLIEGLVGALAAAEDAGTPVVITGAGRAFCAGADLVDLPETEPGSSLGEQVAVRMQTHFNDLVRRTASADVPVVAAVNGIAAGGGMGLALAVDVTVAAESASFVSVFAQQLGLVPDMGASWLVPRAVGRARALGLALLGEPIDAATAADWGLVWEVAPDDAVVDRAIALARRLGRLPAATLHAVRRTVEASTDGFVPALATEWELQADLVDRGHLLEGIDAFFAGRPPTFDS